MPGLIMDQTNPFLLLHLPQDRIKSLEKGFGEVSLETGDPTRSSSEDGLSEWEPDWEQPQGERAQEELQEMGIFPKTMELSPAW